MDKQTISQVAEQLQNSATIGIVCGGEPSIDTLGSALALSLGLQELGKSTQVVTKNPILAQHSRLVGVDKVEQQLAGQKSYVIALPNAVDSIEKVSCYAEGQKLNIVLQPYPDVTDFNFSDASFIKTGGTIDTLVLIDVPNMQEVNQWLGDQSNVPMIALGKQVDQRIQKRIQSPNQLTSAVPVLALLQNMQAKITGDMASNLLQAIYEATQDFHNPNVNPRLFEDAAFLLKTLHASAGKTVSPVPAAPMQPAMPPMPSFGQPPRPQGNFPMPTMPGMPQAPMPPMPPAPFPQPRPMPQPGAFPPPPMPRPPMPNMPAMPGGQPPMPQPPMPRPTPAQQEQFARVAKEWEIDEDFEFEKAPDQQFYGDQSMQGAAAQPAAPREGQALKTKQPQPNRQPMPQQQRPNNQNRQPQGQPKPDQATAKQQGDSQQAEEDWLSPKIYKTEDLL